MTRLRWCVALLLGVGPLVAALGQPAADDLAALRARSPLTDEDRAKIRTFVEQQVAAVSGTDAAAARAAAQTLRAGYSGGDEFKKAYAAACLEVFGPAVPKAEVAAAAQLLTVLATFNVAEAQGLFGEALRDQRVGVRGAAAVGLRALRPVLAQAGGGAYTNTLNVLKEAGKKENGRDALRAIYAALDYADVPKTPDLKPDVAAVLEVLDERARAYAPGQVVPALGADDAGLLLADRLLKNMSPEERKRLTIVAATMMRWAIEEYTTRGLFEIRDKAGNRPQTEHRNGVERLVLAGEKLLVALLSPKQAPTVLESMRKLDAAAMKLQWKEWVKLLQEAVNQDFTLVEAEAGAAGGTE